MLCSQHDHYMRRLKIHYYENNDRAGKTLGYKLMVHSAKLRIPLIEHRFTKQRLKKPQHIADAFLDYYSALYNLNKDASTLQPT